MGPVRFALITNTPCIRPITQHSTLPDQTSTVNAHAHTHSQGKPEVVTTREEAEEMASAYRKGIKDAEGKLRQHIVAQKEQWTQVRTF